MTFFLCKFVFLAQIHFKKMVSDAEPEPQLLATSALAAADV
jgi:hypothetical protein